jgi:hypothetical protein
MHRIRKIAVHPERLVIEFKTGDIVKPNLKIVPRYPLFNPT